MWETGRNSQILPSLYCFGKRGRSSDLGICPSSSPTNDPVPKKLNLTSSEPISSNLQTREVSLTDTSVLAANSSLSLPIIVNSMEHHALVDTGSLYSYINPCGLEQIRAITKPIRKTMSSMVKFANGSSDVIEEVVSFDIALANRSFTVNLGILPALTVPFLFGVDTLVALGIVIDFSSLQWYFRDSPSHPYRFPIGNRRCTPNRVCGIQRLSNQEHTALQTFLKEELLLFDQHATGATSLVQHRIDVGGHAPIKQRAYPASPKIQEAINAEIDRLLEGDIIEPSHSPWANPVVMVRKPNGTYRFCIDFRKVNAISKKDVYPLPNMASLLDQLKNCRYMSKLDLAQAYLQVPLAEECREITAFIVLGRGLYHFKRMPYGLSGAPATFQRLLDSVIGPELAPACFVYLDDIIIATDSFEDHLRYLQIVLSRLRNAGLKVNLEKCEFGCSELQYLGFIVNESGLQVDPSKVEAVLSFPSPHNVTDLRRFLGLASWYRRFIPQFSSLCSPLTKLLRKKEKWHWGTEQAASMSSLKSILTTPPILARPNFSFPFVLQTDASYSGLGAVLSQCIEETERVIAFASRSLTKAEQNYSVTEKECLAVVWSIKKFRPYLEGYKFTVITDHSSLKWLNNLKNPTGRLARWSLELQGYDFEVKYRKGALHKVPDALSRSNLQYEDESLEDTPIHVIIPQIDPQDSWYNEKMSRVKENPERFPDWKLSGASLYFHRINPFRLDPSEDPNEWKLVVPKSKQTDVLRECHDRPESGHLGNDKTYSRVKLKYFWPGMYRDITKYVQGCRVCQQQKPVQRAPAGLMSPRHWKVPWEVVASDIMGPLPRSGKGFTHILIFEDLFSKWVEIVPIRSANASTVVRCFKEYVIYRWGTPSVLITDNGTPYVNNMMRGLADTFGIEFRNTPPYWPQANPVERVNRTVKTMISSYLDGDHKKWDTYLSEFMFAINSSVSATTGYSPALVNFGREMNQPNTIRDKVEGPEEVDCSEPTTWQKSLCKLQELRLLVEQHQSSSSKKQSHYYNLRRRPAQFKVGDTVYKKTHLLSSAGHSFTAKLAPKFEGPYIVSKRISNNLYELSTTRGKKIGQWHVAQLKPFLNGTS